MNDTRYAVFAFDYGIKKFNEYLYESLEECQFAMDSFTEFGITSFICLSDPSMDGKIAEILLTPGTCFNAS